jgi:tetratricopeptide (TPR) repeat protein
VAVSEQAVQIGEQLQDSRVQGEAWTRVGICCFFLEQFSESVDAYMRSVPFLLSESDESSAANSIRHAIDGLMQLDNYEEAVRVAKEGQTYAEMANNDHLLAELLSAHANALVASDLHIEAIPVYESAREVWKRHQQVHRVIDTDAMLAHCHELLGDTNMALVLMKNSYELAVAADRRKMIVVQGLRLGRLHDLRDEFAPAEEVLDNVWAVASRHEDFSSMASAKAWLANNYRQTERLDLAYETAKAAMMIFDSIGETLDFDYVVATAVAHPIAVERQDHEWIVRSATGMLDYGCENGWPDVDAIQAADAYLSKLESLAELGRGEDLVATFEDQAPYENAVGLEGDADRVRRMRMAAAEVAWHHKDFLAVIDLVNSRMPELENMEHRACDARAYELLAKAQAELQMAEAAENLAMAHALYFRFSRYVKALELQEAAVAAGMAKLRARRVKELIAATGEVPEL